MGGFYGSIQVRTTNRAAVKAAAEAVATARKIHCLIGPELNGWVGVYPEGHGQDDSVGKEIAKQIDADVLQLMVHDDDVLAYWLWRKHEMVDSYWPKPGYFGEGNRAEEERRRGDPEKFRLIIGEKVDRLAALLDRDMSSVFEYERLNKLAKLLGISNAVSAYEYLKAGERKDIRGWRQFEEIPASQIASEGDQRRAEKNLIKALRAGLMKSGVLLHFEEQKAGGASSIACAVGDGLVIAKPDYGMRTLAVYLLQSPWTSIEPLSIESPVHVTAVVSDAEAKRVAFAAGECVRIWDVLDGVWQHLLDIPEVDLAIGAAISPDGKIVVHASRNEIVFSEIPGGRRLFTIPPRNQRQMAFHPSGQWLAAAGNTLGIVSINDDHHLRDIYVGGKSSSSGMASMALQKQLRNIDLDKLEKDRREQFEKELKKMESQQTKSKAPGFSKEQLEKARQVMETSITTMLARLRAVKSGDTAVVPGVAETSNELVMCVGFSRDGRWIYCGTNFGIRVYEWESFPREPGCATPPPTWQYSPQSGGSHDSHRQINAVVEEADGSGLVFAGWAGELLRIDVNTGEVRSLVSIPGGGGIWSLAMSRNGDVLAVSSQFSRRLNQGSLLPDSYTFEVWSYPRLRDSATKNS